MHRTRDTDPKAARQSAAEWLVALDSAPTDRHTDGEFAEWLESNAAREAELERCEAALAIARELRNDPALRWAFDEAAALASERARQTRAGVRHYRALLGRPMAWATTAFLSAVVASALIIRTVGNNDTATSEPGEDGAASALLEEDAASSISIASRPSMNDTTAGNYISVAAPASEPTVVLPGQIVVDAKSVAVLPFAQTAQRNETAASAGAGATPIATALHGRILTDLASIPGLYVIGQRSVLPYRESDLMPHEIAAQLGVRGVVEGSVDVNRGGVLVTGRLVDAATGEVLWQRTYDRSLDDLPDVQADIVANVAASIAEPVALANVRPAPRF